MTEQSTTVEDDNTVATAQEAGLETLSLMLVDLYVAKGYRLKTLAAKLAIPEKEFMRFTNGELDVFSPEKLTELALALGCDSTETLLQEAKAAEIKRLERNKLVGFNFAACVEDIVNGDVVPGRVAYIFAKPKQIFPSSMKLLWASSLEEEMAQWHKSCAALQEPQRTQRFSRLRQTALDLIEQQKLVPPDAKFIDEHAPPPETAHWIEEEKKFYFHAKPPVQIRVSSSETPKSSWPKPLTAAPGKTAQTPETRQNAHILGPGVLTGTSLAKCVPTVVRMGIPTPSIDRIYASTSKGFLNKTFTDEELRHIFNSAPLRREWGDMHGACVKKAIELVRAGKIYEPKCFGEPYNSLMTTNWRYKGQNLLVKGRSDGSELLPALQEMNIIPQETQPSGVGKG